jgi:gas vesicle protein
MEKQLSAFVGSLIGILFAPKSGEETRKYLSQKVDERERVRPEESAGTEGAG